MEEKRKFVISKLNEELEDEKLSLRLEKSIFNHTIRRFKEEGKNAEWIFKMYYTNKAKHIIYNLKLEKNAEFKRKVKAKEYCIKYIPYLKPEEIYPELYEEIFRKQMVKEMQRMKELSDAEMYESGLYQCGKCKSRSTVFFSLQTRSADEPMTNYITCNKCGNKWKE